MAQTGTTKSGFKFTISDEALNDMEIVDALAELDDHPTKISFVVLKLLGDSQRKKLYDHLRTKSGHVPIDKVGREVKEMLDLINAKNS